MSDQSRQISFESVENRYEAVLASSKRSRQLLDRAEKHGMSADVAKVILQSLDELLSGKVTFQITHTTPKKRHKEKSDN